MKESFYLSFSFNDCAAFRAILRIRDALDFEGVSARSGSSFRDAVYALAKESAEGS